MPQASQQNQHKTLRRAAVLAGVNNYWLGPGSLQFAEADCHKLRDALCQQRFGIHPENVYMLTASEHDARKCPIRSKLLYEVFKQFETADLDLFIFFFAGHGIEAGGKSYLIPADGLRDQLDTCVPLQGLLEQVSRI